MREAWVGKISWRKERLPTSVFWPGELHRLYSPWGRKESDMTERLSLSLFFGIRMKTDLFLDCGHCWVFQICWHVECSTFTASSCRIWNSSTGIPSPPLALFTVMNKVMLPKAHLTLHSRMSDSRWLITPLWLSGSWRSLKLSHQVTQRRIDRLTYLGDYGFAEF